MNSKRKEISVFFALVIISSLYALIQMKVFWPKGLVLAGDDMEFHINRIMGVAEAFKTHHYPFYINDIFLNGYGYAANWFYPDLFLFPMAILLNLGYSLVFSYKAYIIIYTVATACVTYYCIHKMSKKTYLSACTALLYTFSFYRAFDVYQRASLGEALAFIFFPVILYGTYEILYGDKRKFYILVIGFSGMIYAHVLSSVLAFVLVLLLLLFSVNKLWEDKSKILYFVIAGCVTVLLTSSFIFPMIEQMKSNTFYYSTYSLVNVDEQAYTVGRLVKSILSMYKGSPIIGLGFAIFIPLIFRFTINEKNSMIRFADKCLMISVILLVMTTKLFPWNHYHLLGVIQFPFRFFTIITLLVTFSGSVYLSYSIKKHYRKVLLLFILLVLSLVNTWEVAQYYKDFRLNGSNQIKKHHTFDYPYEIGAGREYLPSVAKIDDIKSRGKDEIRKENNLTTLGNLSRSMNHLSIEFNTPDKDTLEMPLVYYKGYQAKINGNEVPLTMSKNGLIEVQIQGKGSLEISYVGTVVQKVSYFTSITVFLLLLGFIIFENIRTNRLKQQIIQSSTERSL